MMPQCLRQQQQQSWRASQPSTAPNGRRPVHSSAGVAVRQPLQALRPRTHGLKLRCRAGQHAEDSVVTADRQLDEGARNPTISPPRGIVANNAVALWRRRRRQQGREPEDKNSSSAAASAAEAAHESAKPGVDAGVDSVTVQQAQHPAAAQPQAHPSVDDAPGSVLGAVALITGSTVGAGILALPSVAAPAGFGPSTGEHPPSALGACWLLLAAQAMLLAEVNLGVTASRAQEQATAGQPAGRQMVTLRQMAGATLGRAGGAAASATYLLLSLSLLTAYIAKAGEMVGAGSAVDPTVAGAGFTAALGGMMCFGGASTADTVNRWLTGALMLVFGGILAFGAGHADASLLAATVDWRQAPPAIPIIFLSLVFHDLVPVVCAQLGGDRARVRTALLAGSLLPLAMFVSWDAIMLALTGEPGAAAAGDPLAVLIADSDGAVGWALQGFSLLALATSFIGTCTGLTSTLQSEYAAVTGSAAEPDADSQLRSPDVSKAAGDSLAEGADAGSTADAQHSHPAPQFLVYLAALLPPLAVASAHPGSFLTLLSAAGGYGMSFLYGVMPPLMAWRLRSRMLPGSEASHWMPGGSGMLAALCASAVAVEVGQAAMSYGWL